MRLNAMNGKVPIGDTHMSYASFGHGEKAFVILPGLSDGLTTVDGKALLLAKPYEMFFDRYTVYMFSRKDYMPKGYSIRDMACDQAEALRALGINKASVMGVSQGGMIAQCLAADHPGLAEKLVLAVTAPAVSDMIAEGLREWMKLAESGDHKALMISTAEKSYSEAYLKKYRKLYPILRFIGRPSDYGRFMVNAEAILNFGGAGDLGKIQCPTLVIGGSEDKIVGAGASYALHEQIPGSELYIYEGLGHAAYEEAKDFNTRVFEFLERDDDVYTAE